MHFSNVCKLLIQFKFYFLASFKFERNINFVTSAPVDSGVPLLMIWDFEGQCKPKPCHVVHITQHGNAFFEIGRGDSHPKSGLTKNMCREKKRSDGEIDSTLDHPGSQVNTHDDPL